MRVAFIVTLLFITTGCLEKEEIPMNPKSGDDRDNSRSEKLEEGWDLKDPYLEGRDIDWLIANLDDFDLCNVVFKRIGRKFGHRVYVPQYTEEERVVMLAWHVAGIIDNGGFEYLFEGDIPGDPGYRQSLQAFEAIGFDEGAAAFREALSKFPDGKVPADPRERATMFRQVPECVRLRLNERFWGTNPIGSAKITRLLADYIRAHKEAFRIPEGQSYPKPWWEN